MGPRSSGDVRAEPQPRIGREGFRGLSCSYKSQMEHPSPPHLGREGRKNRVFALSPSPTIIYVRGKDEG